MIFRTLRINLTEGAVKEEPFDQLDYGYHGGRGLVADFMNREIPVDIDPLGPEAKILFCTGYFSGTRVPASNRLSVGAKSPLTGLIKESNSGGTFARRMTDHKIKQIILEGQSDKWVYIYIDKEGQVHIKDAHDLVGKCTYELVEYVQKRYNDRVAIATIGPAGEHLTSNSSIMCTEMLTNFPCRAAARGGLGSVMGSKKVKCIVIEHADDAFVYKCPTPEFQAEFEELNKIITDAIFKNPLTGQTMPLYGSAAGVDTTGKMGALPWNNFNGRFTPGWERLGTVEWRRNVLEHGGHSTIACQPSCTVRCSEEYCDRNGKYLSAGIEYETVALCGSNIGVFDTDIVCTLDRLCDEYGMDTIDMGCALGVAMDYGVMQFGDAETAIAHVRHMFAPDATPFEIALRGGCASVADFLGVDKKDVVNVPVSKRQAFAAYDPRIIRGYGLSWERGPMGADHTQGSAATFLAQLTPEQQTDSSLGATCTCDCFMCLFPWAAVNYNPNARPAIMRMAAILSGKDETPGAQGVEANGMPILMAEYAWNERAGWPHSKDAFYGGKNNYMYKTGHEAARGGVFRSIQDGPLPPPPAPPAAPKAEEKKEEPKAEEKK